jgi:hypothetical protein
MINLTQGLLSNDSYIWDQGLTCYLGEKSLAKLSSQTGKIGICFESIYLYIYQTCIGTQPLIQNKSPVLCFSTFHNLVVGLDVCATWNVVSKFGDFSVIFYKGWSSSFVGFF